MPLMEWDETMSVGVEELDRQHQTLIDLINEAYAAIQKHDGHMVSAILTRMQEYAALHFAAEERYMKDAGYPDLDAHTALHAAFVKDVEGFQREQHKKTNLSKLFVYLSRWLTRHIMDEDRKYSESMAVNAESSGE